MSHNTTQNHPIADSRYTSIFDQALQDTAEHLGVNPDKLLVWFDQYPLIQAPTQLRFLHLIKKYDLDPFADELSILKDAEGSCQVFITVDGWFKIINQHAQYTGMSLRESTEENNAIPIWMECCIYRNDRILPIVVKEYFDEVKTEHPSWKQMPRRMLRYRVIQQCARMAFGISAPEYIAFKNPNTATEVVKVTPSNTKDVPAEVISHTERLKKKLAKS
jgi:hypothetical protein